jgi:hypothetical protein
MRDASQGSIATARRLLRRRGQMMTFRLYGATPDKRLGKQTIGPVGSPVQALAVLLDPREDRVRGMVEGDQVLMVEAPPFGEGGLTDRWRVDWGTGPRRISGQVAAARGAPNLPAAYYEATVRSVGTGPGDAGDAP